MMCARCKCDKPIGTVHAGVFACSDCITLSHRCKRCDLGKLVYSPTPNNMGRHRCDSCKRVSKQPARLL